MRKNTTRRHFIQSAVRSVGAASIAAHFTGCQQPKKQPNILFIFSDQQHWQAMGSIDPFFKTLHLDAFTKESVVFEQAYCTTPQCSPSRSSIMTGLYPHKTGVYGNVGHAGGDPLKQHTIGWRLQQHGYFTGYFGKWHLGKEPIAISGWDRDHGVTNKIGWNAETDRETTKRGIQFLKDAKDNDRAFALFLSYNDPHDIYYFAQHPITDKTQNIPLPDSWKKETFINKPKVQKQFMLEDQGKQIWGKDKIQWQRYRDCYRSKVKIYDNHVGRVIDALKKNGYWDNTLVFITSDHGDMDTCHHLIFKGPFMYDQMMRVPCMIRVPRALGGVRPYRNRNFNLVNVDFVPTILDFCGIDDIDCDGLSLKPLLTGKSGQKTRDFVIGEYYGKQQWVNPIRMLETRNYKYNQYIEHGNELYDLQNDPHELQNVVHESDYQGEKENMKRLLDTWIKENKDPFYSLKTTELDPKTVLKSLTKKNKL